MVMDPLDDFLLTITDSNVRDVKRMLRVLREAYTCGVPPMMAKSITDRLKQAGGFEFYLGTPPDELRRIVEDIATEIAKNAVDMSKHAKRKTVKAEDVKLASKPFVK